MNYPIVIHKDKDSDYGVTVPDLPGCFSAGATLDEAITMAREAIELHLEGLIEDGQLVREPADIEARKDDPQFAGGVWAIASVDEANLRIRAKRVNITLPERVLGAVDRFAKARGQSRSNLLARAAVRYMDEEGNVAKTRPRFRRAGKLRSKQNADK